MNAQQHIPVEDLAAYAAGDLDTAASVAVEAHLVLCADCRTDVDAITNATAALTALDRPVMPADVAARVDAALAAERAAPAATVLPLLPKRRRPSFAGIAAVAAGVALVAAIGVPLVTGGSGKKAGTEASSPKTTTRRLSSGLDYRRGALAATLGRALGGAENTQADAGASAPGPVAGGVAIPGAPTPVPTTSGTLTLSEKAFAAARTSLVSLQRDAARLAACIDSLAAGLAADVPVEARVPVVVDFATFAGQPAVLVAFPTVSQGAVRTDRIDVFVAGPRCGITAGDDDFLDFERIPRPAGL